MMKQAIVELGMPSEEFWQHTFSSLQWQYDRKAKEFQDRWDFALLNAYVTGAHFAGGDKLKEMVGGLFGGSKQQEPDKAKPTRLPMKDDVKRCKAMLKLLESKGQINPNINKADGTFDYNLKDRIAELENG